MKNIFILAVAMFLAPGFVSAQQANTEKSRHKVLFQLSSGDTLAWKGLMNNIKNLKAALHENVDIEVVVHGPGISLLMKDKTTQAENIIHFKSKGVSFMACENTLLERKIAKESIVPEAGFVKSAVVEIMLKQEEGWTFIKSGF